MNLFRKEKPTYRHRKKLTVTKGKRGEGINLEYEINRHTPTAFRIGEQQGLTV